MTLSPPAAPLDGAWRGERESPVCSLLQVQAALELQRRKPIVGLRQALVALGMLDLEASHRLFAEDPDLFRSRSSELVARTLISEDELQRALAHVAGLVEVDLAEFDIERDAFKLLPVAQARMLNVIPLGMANDQLVVASCTPTSAEQQRQLSNLSGHSVLMVWAPRHAIAQRLDRQERMARDALAHGESLSRGDMRQKIAVNGSGPSGSSALGLEDLVVQAMSEVGNASEAEQLASAAESAGMVRLVNEMISEAQRTHASDIHIESNAGDAMTVIRFRRDGDLEPYLMLPAGLRGPLVSRVKIMAKLDIAERRRPQDGKIDFSEFGGRQLELRVAVMPTHDGLEDVVLRLLESAKPLPLAKLGLQPRDMEIIASFSQRTFGMVLAAGPTGSGKTTTLHSMLAEVNTPDRKIWTAEDPIEITQPGLRQVQMNAKIGLTFANAMRGFLRADPDIIMVGEIRDAETAKVAIEASLTGHLVLSTLHTNNASESVVRLLDLGMDPMNFADSLLGIVAQRLVRLLCDRCAEVQPLDEAAWDALLAEYMEGSELTREEAQERLFNATAVQSTGEIRVRRPVGCEHCAGKGYKGRIGVYEILQNSRAIKQLIQSRARPSEVFDAAVREGMRSLRHDALEKVVQGLIDIKQARLAYR
jgi:type II secretory ATPase GspE/PulE/Tfp pilus assembly ATPase PilB-like protein